MLEVRSRRGMPERDQACVWVTVGQLLAPSLMGIVGTSGVALECRVKTRRSVAECGLSVGGRVCAREVVREGREDALGLLRLCACVVVALACRGLVLEWMWGGEWFVCGGAERGRAGQAVGGGRKPVLVD